jgi:hypothetical protein
MGQKRIACRGGNFGAKSPFPCGSGERRSVLKPGIQIAHFFIIQK